MSKKRFGLVALKLKECCNGVIGISIIAVVFNQINELILNIEFVANSTQADKIILGRIVIR